MKTAGYSGTPLAKKLGIKEGFTIAVINAPTHYFNLFADFPNNVIITKDLAQEHLDFVHFFSESKNELENKIFKIKASLKKTGMLWVSWPKGSSKIPTDLNRDYIREHILNIGLVDVKVAAVDENWSGLKFVYRVKDR